VDCDWRGPEGTAIIQRRKFSEQVPRIGKRKARILNREICAPRETSFAGLQRAGRSSTLRRAGKTLTRLETVQNSELGINGALLKKPSKTPATTLMANELR
jgi:hypothetical protein